MTLEEAIAHQHWCADNCEGEVRDEHLQMADWLEELVRLRAENAKLREQVTRLQADWESERDYADQMEAKEKRAVAENEKLRELARKWYPHMLKRVGRDALEQWGQMDVVKELGIEV